MVKFKRSVRLNNLTPGLLAILTGLYIVERSTLIESKPDDLWVTSVNDGRHQKNPPSRHYSDEAVDVRSWNFRSDIHKDIFASRLEIFLNRRFSPTGARMFRVLYESTIKKNGKVIRTQHFHIQVIKGGEYLRLAMVIG
jgi:hypothetical protein